MKMWALRIKADKILKRQIETKQEELFFVNKNIKSENGMRKDELFGMGSRHTYIEVSWDSITNFAQVFLSFYCGKRGFLVE